MTKQNELKDYEVRPYPIRVPVELKKKIEESAKKNNRSYHAEIVYRLEESYAPPPSNSYEEIDRLIDRLTQTKLQANNLYAEFKRLGETDETEKLLAVAKQSSDVHILQLHLEAIIVTHPKFSDYLNNAEYVSKHPDFLIEELKQKQKEKEAIKKQAIST